MPPAELPRRVNLVYGRRWGLTKMGWGDCPVDVAHITELRRDGNFKHSSYRWKVERCRRSAGEVFIRSDHHPQRYLTAGIPPVLQDLTYMKYTDNHRWELRYLNGASGVDAPFHLRSKTSGMYLVIDEEGEALLQTDEPDMTWACTSATWMGPSSLDRTPRSPFSGSRPPSLSPLPGSPPAGPSRPAQTALHAFDGDMIAAFDALPVEPDIPRETFTDMRCFMDSRLEELCNDAAFLPSFDVNDLFPALFAAHSDFSREFHEHRGDRDVLHLPAQPQVPFGAAATLRCNVPLPVLGTCSYYEAQRCVLCSERSAGMTLAFQQVGNISAKFYGNIRSETLYLFSQQERGGPLRLRALVPSPTGMFAEKALEGHRKALEDFRVVALRVLTSCASDHRPERVRVPKGDQLLPRPSALPLCGCYAGLLRARLFRRPRRTRSGREITEI